MSQIRLNIDLDNEDCWTGEYILNDTIARILKIKDQLDNLALPYLYDELEKKYVKEI